jgi:hypothetical protein
VTSKQEAQWMLRAQLDDREAIEALLSSVQPRLTRYVRAIVGAADAEDITQEVMVSIYRAPDFSPDAHAATGDRGVGPAILSGHPSPALMSEGWWPRFVPARSH